MYKLIYFAPDGDLECTKAAVFAAGGGGIGNYSHCAWQVKGIGQFKPLDGANPTIGTIGDVEQLEEWRVELLVPEDKLKKVVRALIKAHSYEEPAWEVVRLVDLDLLDAEDSE